MPEPALKLSPKRFPARFERIGLGTAAIGGLLVASTHIFVWPGFPRALNPVIFLGALLYLVGAFLAVAATGYQRRTRPFVWLRVLRLVFLTSIIFALMRDMSSR